MPFYNAGETKRVGQVSRTRSVSRGTQSGPGENSGSLGHATPRRRKDRKRLQSMLLTLQAYNLKVVYKPGPDMHISDSLSRATAPPQGPGTTYTKQTICCLQGAQVNIEHINQAEYLNVTSQRLRQIKAHTDGDGGLQMLQEVVLRGWPNHWEDTPLAIREYWSFRDEISAQDGVLFKISVSQCPNHCVQKC